MSRIGDGFDVRSLASTYRDGTVLGAHDHPWGQLVYARSGVMRVIAAGSAWLTPPTRAVWLPAGVTHQIAMKGDVAMRTLYIAPERADGLSDQVAVLEIAPLLRELILHILAVGMLDPLQPEHDRLAGVLIDLMCQARPLDLALQLPRDPRALALAERIQAAPGEAIALAELARRAAASLRTLQRLFPDETSLTLESWRQKARLIAAVGQLSGGASVTTTALDCGYESPSAFITAFKRQFGVTPGRYRAAGR